MFQFVNKFFVGKILKTSLQMKKSMIEYKKDTFVLYFNLIERFLWKNLSRRNKKS